MASGDPSLAKDVARFLWQARPPQVLSPEPREHRAGDPPELPGAPPSPPRKGHFYLTSRL